MDLFFKFGKSVFLAFFLYLVLYLFISLFGLSISEIFIGVIFILSIFLSFIFVFKKSFFKPILIFSLIYIVGYFLFKNIFDISYDGNTYHLDAILQILNGKNIFYDDFGNSSFYLDFYPKTVEILFSGFSSILGIFNARILKLFLIFITFGNYFYLLKKYDKKINILNVILGTLFILNPVVINQFFTLYIDDVLFLFLINTLFYIFIGEYFFGLIVFSIMGSAKITYLAFGVLDMIYALYLRKNVFLKNYKTLSFGGKKRIINKFFHLKYPESSSGGQKNLKLFLIIILSFFVLFHQNIINYINLGNPFYGFVGKSASMGANMANDKPPIMQGNKLKEFLITYFSNTAINCKTTNECIDFFDFSKISGIKNFINSYKITYIYDLQTSGFGGIYSIVLLLNIICGILFLINKSRKKSFDFEFKIVFSTFVFVLILLILMPLYWARYVPFLSFLVFIFIFLKSNKLKYFFIILLIINLALILSVNGYFYTNKFLNQKSQAVEIKTSLEKMQDIFYYKKDFQTSFELEYFKDYYKITKKEILTSKQNLLEFCGITSDNQLIKSKLKIIKCPNSGMLLKTNIGSFLEDLIYIDIGENTKTKAFLNKKPVLNIEGNTIFVDKNIYKISKDFIGIDDNLCENGYKKMSKIDWEKLISDLGISISSFIELLDKTKTGYIDENNNLIKNNQYYFSIGKTPNSSQEIVVLARNRFEYFYTKPINAKLLNLCIKN